MHVSGKQTAYNEAHIDLSVASLDELIVRTMYRYLREDLGLPEPLARERASLEVAGTIGKSVCDECEKAGLTFRGKRVLDLGAGLGGLSVEVANRGASFVAVEPGVAWRGLASRRLSSLGRGTIIGAVGELLPLADDSIDLIISLQVLEHVQNPCEVIREAFRVLKPGGYIYIRYENYLSFWEPHYRVRWLPLLPKGIGAAYLRALKKNPRFLRESITYTTFPAVRRNFFAAGFECMRLRDFQQSLRSPQKTSVKWRILKTIASVQEHVAFDILAAGDYARRMFRTAVQEFMRKPAG